ncbi:hypothetical protein CEXT_11941 [Caerostris extrusa]|uniref:Uncharacterized protein n=1 Tax=Caerostris extrusa TaxID=172846 RepID=A0AAV4UV10_CAEEX|nr:hypothetical protein CEXT_11941 [Caerostris extrusa]
MIISVKQTYIKNTIQTLHTANFRQSVFISLSQKLIHHSATKHPTEDCSKRIAKKEARDLPSGSKKKSSSIDDIPAESCLHCYPFLQQASSLRVH